MSRLRDNNAGGTLGATLDTNSGSEVITGLFGIAPAFATIVAPDYRSLQIDANTASFEVVWLTAYTSGSTNGTILRGQEGTSPVAHTSGVATWINGPTAADFVPNSDQLSVSSLAPSVSQNVPGGFSLVVADHYEILLGLTTEIGLAGIMEIT